MAALVTTRRGGVSTGRFASLNLGAHVGDDPEAVAANRARLYTALELPSEPRWLEQVHGTKVARFAGKKQEKTTPSPLAGEGRDGRYCRDTASDFAPGPIRSHTGGTGKVGAPCIRRAGPDNKPPEADAAVTREAGIVLAVLTADCLPVMLAARDGSIIGVAHAGWRGLAAGVIEVALAAMAKPAGDVLAWLGPAIEADGYEVGNDVREAFTGSPGAGEAFTPSDRGGHWQCDLVMLARARLHEAGVGHVAGGNRDTFTRPEHFYSHRRDGETGRMASLIWKQEA